MNERMTIFPFMLNPKKKLWPNETTPNIKITDVTFLSCIQKKNLKGH